MINVETKWLEICSHSAKEEGSWFFGISAFRHRWEFGFDRDWHEDGAEMVASRYYLYAQRFDRDGLTVRQYEFPRKNRWTHVTGI